jgi:hypothetical protein
MDSPFNPRLDKIKAILSDAKTKVEEQVRFYRTKSVYSPVRSNHSRAFTVLPLSDLGRRLGIPEPFAKISVGKLASRVDNSDRYLQGPEAGAHFAEGRILWPCVCCSCGAKRAC